MDPDPTIHLGGSGSDFSFGWIWIQILNFFAKNKLFLNFAMIIYGEYEEEENLKVRQNCFVWIEYF